MSCLRPLRTAFTTSKPLTAALRQTTRPLLPEPHLQQHQQLQLQFQQRPFALLTRPTRPTLPHTTNLETPALTTPSLLPLQLARGAKRDTFNPSHRVRKRRHGFLARLRTRTGRKVLLRRKLKGRNTLSH
ncbi:hypothetical protein B0A50_04841 [Salinomyces thailandicus]|uniref:Large ribosomal subunit protein bL34m n=1 Tax=Salinomyces thailandicus TaxID=706561 RepID=A0A4U0TYV9_9PEZI|nr:hypothetical protein B0A50_04841 [Salinomyces thailandica]